MGDNLLDILEKLNQTVAFVTNNAFDASFLADQIILLAALSPLGSLIGGSEKLFFEVRHACPAPGSRVPGRRAHHERKIVSNFRSSSVRPEHSRRVNRGFFICLFLVHRDLWTGAIIR